MTFKNKSLEGEELVVAGRVRKAFGIRGQLSVDWNNGSSPVSVGQGTIYLKAEKGGDLIKFTVTGDHSHGRCNIVNLKELDSRTEAERYRGSQIWVKKGDLPPLAEDEYYSFQLIDMRVETVQGDYLGDIAEIMSTGSNDVYVVKKGTEEILIPAIKDVVKKVDIKAGVMVIEMIEGLI